MLSKEGINLIPEEKFNKIIKKIFKKEDNGEEEV